IYRVIAVPGQQVPELVELQMPRRRTGGVHRTAVRGGKHHVHTVAGGVVLPGVQRVIARPAIVQVIADRTVDTTVTPADTVVAVLAMDGVVAAAILDDVIAAAAKDFVIAVAALNIIRGVAANDVIIASTRINPDAFSAARRIDVIGAVASGHTLDTVKAQRVAIGILDLARAAAGEIHIEPFGPCGHQAKRIAAIMGVDVGLILLAARTTVIDVVIASRVRIGRPDQEISTVTTTDRIATRAAIYSIVAGISVDEIGFVPTRQAVIAARSRNRRHETPSKNKNLAEKPQKRRRK